MQRWQLTTGLAAGALLAALFVPSLLRSPLPQPAPQAPQPVPLVTPTPPVVQSGPLSLSASLDQSALLQGAGEDRFLVIELQADEIAGGQRMPVHLAVVMDTSGSMGGKGKITSARMAAEELAGLLGPEDTMSVVTFSDRADVLVRAGGSTESDRMKRLIKGIKPGGGTNIYDGLTQGQALLQDSALSGSRRVVLLSDGMANLGVTDPGELARISGSMVSQGITVTGLGLGLDYNEDLLAAMSDAGGGDYHFVDQSGQLTEMFSQELVQMGAIAGREVSVSVDLGSGVELLEVYSYAASTTQSGFGVFIGDVHSGETRKIIARVRVDDRQLGDVDIAAVSVRYVDPAGTGSLVASAAVNGQITAQSDVAERSVNKRAGANAAQAAAASLLDQSARDLQNDDKPMAAARLQEGEQLLQKLSTRYDAPELDDMADLMAEQRNAIPAASPAESQYRVKKAKEQAREYSR